MTDLDSCYYECLSKTQIVDRAHLQSIEDLDDKKLLYLLTACKDSVEKEHFHLTRNRPGWELKISEPIEWKFLLRNASLEETSKFFGQLNRQHFRKEALMMHRMDKLQQLLDVRDYYIMFLSQNLKSINGGEVIRKFNRNFKDQSKLLQLKKEDWQKWSDESYIQNDMWHEVEKVTKYAVKFPKKVQSPSAEKTELLTDEIRVKSEPTSPKPPNKATRTIKKQGFIARKRERSDDADTSPKKFIKRLGQMPKFRKS